MREISAEQITQVVRRLCIEANCHLPQDMKGRIEACRAQEGWEPAREILDRIVENYRIADENSRPICQDTGMACVFLKVGQDVHITGDIREAVDEGVRQGYGEGYLRKSIVADPLRRVNTEDNTPASITVRIVSGDRCAITVVPKGFGSENMSRLAMLKPADGVEGVKQFVVETVRLAGPNPCPPVVLGVGIGGDFELCALLAKRALCRDVAQRNPDPYYADLEARMLAAVNETGVGPQGFGGDVTALAVNIKTYPTHIAGLPVAVNVGCHVTRHKSVTI